MVTAVKRAEDSDALVVRFYELHGRGADVPLSFARPVLAARETDLLERPVRDLEVRHGTVVVPTKPYEIKTLTVTLEKGR
jgi:alpha-mannosidase